VVDPRNAGPKHRCANVAVSAPDATVRPAESDARAADESDGVGGDSGHRSSADDL